VQRSQNLSTSQLAQKLRDIEIAIETFPADSDTFHTQTQHTQHTQHTHGHVYTHVWKMLSETFQARFVDTGRLVLSCKARHTKQAGGSHTRCTNTHTYTHIRTHVTCCFVVGRAGAKEFWQSNSINDSARTVSHRVPAQSRKIHM